MLIFDQLRKDDPQLRAVTVVVLAGLGILAAGLWWVQVVSARDYQDSLETQSYRTVRIPAVRGKILDRNRVVLAENRPTYSISLYLEELRRPFKVAFDKELAAAKAQVSRHIAEEQKALHRRLRKEERLKLAHEADPREVLRERAFWLVASNVVAELSRRMRLPLSLDMTNFLLHCRNSLALPYPVLPNLTPGQIAWFEEQCSGIQGADLELQSTRVYPFGTSAGHVLGYLQRDDSSLVGEDAFYSYRLPDYRGVVGIEGGYDDDLRGTAGAKSVLVNNVGYRQTEDVLSVAEPGHNVMLTLDERIQQAAETALNTKNFGAATRGAVVVMDVNTGDILAMASSPTINPNYKIQGFPPGEYQRLQDPELRPLINRATYENYQPGSIFKTVVAMAGLDNGWDPKDIVHSEGHIYVGRAFHDKAPPGDYDFEKAFRKSSNVYFIVKGLDAGIANIVRVGRRLHLGERMGLRTRQEAPGTFPTLKRVGIHWSDGDTANLCMGQGEIDVTPLQMAVLTSAIANDGKVLWPRLVAGIQPQDPSAGEKSKLFSDSRVRDELGVKPRTLKILREAMLADVEDADSTGHKAAVPGLQVCGKTGTSEKKNAQGQLEEHVTWFISFAPYDHPRYAVVAMVEAEEGFGGTLCAPIAQKIFLTLQQCDPGLASKPADVSQNSRPAPQAP